MLCLRYCLVGVSFLAAGAGSAQIATTTPYEAVSTPHPVDTTGQSQDIAIGSDGHNRMTVRVNVAGTGPYNFLVDTGADHTVVSSALANSLKLGPGARVSMFTIAGRHQVKTAALGDLQFSRKKIRNVNAAVLEQENLGADGVLGIDSLRSQRVTFDFVKGMMTIVPSSSLEPAADMRDAVVVTGRLKAGRLVLTEARAGGKAVNVVIDTGSDVTLGNSALRKRLLGSKRLMAVGPVVLQSVTGHYITGDLMTLDELQVGGVTIQKMSIVFTDAPIFRVLKLDQKPALLLGMNAIRAFDRVSIDFANRKFRVVLPERGEMENVQLAMR
jgi:predicted aspartyl protease